MPRPPPITVYTADRCAHCRAAKAFLARHRLGFREANVSRDRQARSELERLGARGVPVVLVGGRRLDGFDPRRLRRLLIDAGVDLG